MRKAIDAADLKPGQRIFEILPEKVKCRKKKVYGSLDDARKRWRMVLQKMLANHHLDYLACKISTEAQKFGLDKVFTSKRLQLYGAESYRTRLPYNKMSRAVPLFRAIGVVGNDEELANERYAWGLAEFIQDANTENRVSGRKYMEMLRNEWLSGSSEIEECFVEKTVQESYEIDSDDDILTEE